MASKDVVRRLFLQPESQLRELPSEGPPWETPSAKQPRGAARLPAARTGVHSLCELTFNLQLAFYERVSTFFLLDSSDMPTDRSQQEITAGQLAASTLLAPQLRPGYCLKALNPT